MTRPVSAVTPDGRPCIVYRDRVEVPTGRRKPPVVYRLIDMAVAGWLDWHEREVVRAT